jgi:hypothetical protein
LIAAFLGARCTQFREQSKAQFDLRRSLVEREVAACNALLHVCRQMPSLSELELNTRQQDFAHESSVFAAFQKLREEARVSGHLGIETIRAFELAVHERRQNLLEVKTKANAQESSCGQRSSQAH